MQNGHVAIRHGILNNYAVVTQGLAGWGSRCSGVATWLSKCLTILGWAGKERPRGNPDQALLGVKQGREPELTGLLPFLPTTCARL